jgi:hypothetical protein
VQARGNQAPLEVQNRTTLLAGDAVPYAVDAVFLFVKGAVRNDKVPDAVVVGVVAGAKAEACVDG